MTDSPKTPAAAPNELGWPTYADVAGLESGYESKNFRGKIKDMWEAGSSVMDIELELKVSAPTIYIVLRRYTKRGMLVRQIDARYRSKDYGKGQ